MNKLKTFALTLVFLLHGLYGMAQYQVTNLEFNGVNTALAKDGQENIYTVSYDGTSYTVKKFLAPDYLTSTTIHTGLSSAHNQMPWGITVTDNGDVFVLNSFATNNGQIIKLTAPGYGATTLRSGGRYTAITKDRNNNLLTLEYNGVNAYQVVKYDFPAYTLRTVLYGSLTVPASGSTYPWGIVSDTDDNIYLLHFMEHLAGTLLKLTAPLYTSATTLGSGKRYTSLAIDAFNNLYTVEDVIGSSGTTAKIVKYSAPVQANQVGKTLFTGLHYDFVTYPWGLAVNSKHEVFANDASYNFVGRVIQLTAPPVTVLSSTRVNASPTIAGNLAFTVKFSADVNNVTAASFSLNTNGPSGASITGVTGNQDTYTVHVDAGFGDGTIRLDVNGTGILPAFSTLPFTTGEAYTIDRTAPTGTLAVSNAALYTNDPNIVLGVTAADADAVLEMRFSNDNSTWSAFVPFAATYTHTLSAGDGLKNVYMQLRDRAGNVSAGNISTQITLDQTAPNTTITTSPPAVSGSAVTFDFTSNETGVIFEGAIDGAPFTPVAAPYQLTGLADGNHTFAVRAIDAAGNADATPDSRTWRVDVTAPAVIAVIPPVNGYHRGTPPLSFTVRFNEVVNVSGAPYLEVNIGGDIKRASYVTGGGTTELLFQCNLVTGDIDMDGISISNTLFLDGGPIKDLANFDADLTLNGVPPLTGVLVNTIRPSVTLSTTAPAIVNAPFTVQVTFSEVVTGLIAGAFLVTGGATAGTLQTADNITYTIIITPPTVNGTFTVRLPGAAVANIASNTNTISNTLSLQYDNILPVITSVVRPTGDFFFGQPLDLTVTFSENVVVTGIPYLNLLMTSGIYRANYISTAGNTLTFRYTVGVGALEQTNVILGGFMALNGGTVKDAAGNNANIALLNVNTAIVKVNGLGPTATLSTTAANPVTAPYTLNVVFNEAVTGLDLTDFTVTNATLSNLQATNNMNYTLTVTPIAENTVTVKLPAATVINVYSNGNSESNLHSIIYDDGPPVVTHVDVPASRYYHAGETLTYVVHYNQNVTITGNMPSVQVAIGTALVSAVYVSGNGTNDLTFSYVVVPGDIDEDGIVTGTLQGNGGTIGDGMGNSANPILFNVPNTSGVRVNAVNPQVTLTTAQTLVNTPFSVQVQFTEAVTGFAITDLTVTNATLSGFQTADNIVYTVLVTPAAEGNITLELPADAADNTGGNGNIVSNLLQVSYDATAPVISSVLAPANASYKVNDVLNFIVTTSEVIQGSGTPYLDVIIGAATRQATIISGFGTRVLTFSYTVQEGDMDLDGISLGANLITNGATMTDDAGNDFIPALQGVVNTTRVLVNTRHPSAVLTTTAAARVNAPYPVTITFSEAVTGFTATDLTVMNGTAGNLQTTDNITYTATITPTADGTVTIQLPADQAENTGANGNTAANTLSNTYDHTAPAITAAQTFNVMERDPVGTTLGTVTATDASGILQNWAISNDPSGGAFAISANGTITVRDVSLLNNNANTTVALSITVSDGLNTSAPTTVAVVIKAVNKAPSFDTITDKEICITTTTQTFSITGATATEAGQTFGFTISADQQIFDALAIDGAGLVSYKLKAIATGKANITIVIKDNGGTVNAGIDVFQRTFALSVNSLPVISISSNKGTNVSKGDQVQLAASGAASYNWGTATGDVFNVRPQANTTYSVTGTSTAGCMGSAQITINIIEDYKVDAVNILTPNGDGVNDRWVIRNIDSYPTNELKIFDRSGRIVYQRRNYNNDWDATINGRRLPEGTYYYILTIDGSGRTVKGYITVIADRK